MAKIIAFPSNPRCVHQGGKQAKINTILYAGRLAADAPSGVIHTAQIQPIWKSRTRGIQMSVILPARDRPELLNRCLAALTRQTLSPRQYEIIVVDSVPSRASREVVESYLNPPGNGPCIIYLPAGGQDGAAAARNHGWQLARGALIAFTEEDTIPCADWLAQGMLAFNGIAQAVCGQILTPLPGLPTDHERTVKTLEQAEFASINCFCLRQVLQDMGGFDERFGTAGREDSDLYFRLLQANAVICHAPLAVVEHPVAAAPWGTSLLQQQRMQFDALLYKKHPLLYREKISPAIPWHYHAIVMVLLCLVAALVFHETSAALLALACWILLSASLCLQRLRGTEKTASNVSEILLTSLLLPPLAIFWRLVGALRFRVGFI
ncbi:glycosyltransferase family 2 protein [Noviherbaspirillum sedimenti]|uniref:Glycosyltransferase family 2 protein n=1 Tax=Noviherbaspirillum sedimenti TaxID=2320865 RepID=A0A3A3FZE5_9BURK|nr:glycosyltransferase family A protein [Noviherbaspirillum sedimenti]RJG01588.1 glycosyltransferase family 2 protein [Noviherbaspirillum sedimenti]RJG08199.1 glycosyltransferase family 2 protein [Noviherbaspirillum sedimenti]